MKYSFNQQVEVYTQSGWQKGFVLGYKGEGCRVELQNGHIGLYDDKDIRPAHVEADGNEEQEACPIRKRREHGKVGQSATSDPIHPNHYKRFAIDPIEYCLKNGIGFCAGNVIKYVSRFDMKGGLEDLDKAEEYLRRMRKDYAEKQAKTAQQN